MEATHVECGVEWTSDPIEVGHIPHQKPHREIVRAAPRLLDGDGRKIDAGRADAHAAAEFQRRR
jgi:hypothetical protein